VTWIAICVIAIPNRPWKSITAAIASAAIVPCAHLAASQILGSAALPWNRLVVYSLVPVFVAGWTPFISTRLHQLQEDLSRMQDFGSYRLEKLLGRGGMGEVWLARHSFLRRDAAVKLILAELLERASHSERRQIQERFESEAQAIASLRSPHTVAIYDYGLAENGSLYYAMEYLHGLDAQTLVDRHGPQPAGRVVAFLRQACESLEEAHDAGLIHRDIKPSNIFICRIGKRTDFVKVVDFGLVKELERATQTALTNESAIGGTPAFMAPEQVRGEEVDARTDIYGLGCLAYFLLTGITVFDKPNSMAMAVAHLNEQPTPPSRRSELAIPPSLERVVMACLEKKCEDRPQSVAQLRAMLHGCTDGASWTETDANRWWTLHRPEQFQKASL
jgi:serine/threonine-protein kinase